MDKSAASQCLLCFEQITSILSEIVVSDYVYSVRDMLHFFSTKLDESVPQEDTVLCETCAMELSTAFDFLLKVQKAEEAAEKKAHKMPEAEDVLDLTEPENDFNIDAFIERVPQTTEEKPPTPPPAKKPKISLKPKLPDQMDDEIEYPSRVVIFPQFVVCPAEPKKLMEDVAAGRICEEFLQRRNRLKMLDVTGVMVSLENYHRGGALKPEVIQSDQHKDDMYLCRYCPKSFSTAHHLMMHTRKTHVCQFCLQGFAKLDDLHTHIEQEHDKFECHFCPREFSCNNNLRTHLKKRHGVTLPAYVSLITVEKQTGEEDEPLEAPKG